MKRQKNSFPLVVILKMDKYSRDASLTEVVTLREI